MGDRHGAPGRRGDDRRQRHGGRRRRPGEGGLVVRLRVRVERIEGSIRGLAESYADSRGGAWIRGSSGAGACTSGFNVRRPRPITPWIYDYFFITAGHRTADSDRFSARCTGQPYPADYLGTTSLTSVPGDDYGVVRFDPAVAQPADKKGVIGIGTPNADIDRVGDMYVGLQACRLGRTTGYSCPIRVERVNETIDYDGVTVHGPALTNTCAKGGDSGGPVYLGGIAYGIMVAGPEVCDANGFGRTWVQPVREILDAHGLRLY